MLDKPPAMLTQRGLLIFYGIPAFVFGIMLFIERAQHEENPASSGTTYYLRSSFLEFIHAVKKMVSLWLLSSTV